MDAVWITERINCLVVVGDLAPFLLFLANITRSV